MHLSSAPLRPTFASIVLNPTIADTPGNPTVVGNQWVRINGIFSANGNERVVTLGCFLPENDPTTGNPALAPGPYPNPSPPNGHPGAYYFYDDLSLFQLPNVGPNQDMACQAGPVTIGQGCPLPASIGPVTYQWAPTTGLATPNQLTTLASPASTTTYNLTVTVGGRTAQSSVTVTLTSGIPASATQLGSPNVTTTISGSTTYSGAYHVKGDLLLTKGTFTLNPGTTFYFDNLPANGQPIGKITVGNNATLRINNATLRGACNSWFGIVLSQNHYANSHLIIENNSTIANAKYGVYAEPEDPMVSMVYDTQYSITNSQFRNNWTHIYDESQHSSPASSCVITGCSFTSSAQQMLPPYNNTGTGSYNDQITYQALFINPYTYGVTYPNQPDDTNSGTVNVSGNSINTAVYGILNHFQDRNLVNISANVLTNVYTVGIWKAANPIYSVDRNSVSLSASRFVNTVQISNLNPVIGIDAGAFSTLGGRVSNNTIAGETLQNSFLFKEQIGIVAPNELVAVQGNTLSRLSAGTTYSTPNINSFDNRFTNCQAGIKLIPYDQTFSTNIHGPSRVECNTFERANGFTDQIYGIWAPPRIPSGGANDPDREAYLPDLGTVRPCGNSFSNVSTAVQNDGKNLSPTYYRFSNAQETVVGGPKLRVNIGGVAPPNECQSRGANSFPLNGINRQANTFAYVQSLMDSVRLQSVPAARQGLYEGQIIRYFANQADLSALEQYAATIPLANREATYTFNLYLLREYSGKHRPKFAQRAQQQLLALAAGNNDLRQEVAVLSLLARATWPSAGSRLPAADSTLLATAAASGTTVAERAASWLRYYYPHAAPYREPRQSPSVTATAGLPARPLLVESKLYPNPATATAVARYQTAKPGQVVDLQVFSLLTSRQVLMRRLPATNGHEACQEQTISLRDLPAGQYSYRFVVDGQAQAAHHFVIQ